MGCARKNSGLAKSIQAVRQSRSRMCFYVRMLMKLVARVCRKNYKKIASCYYEEPECVKDYVYLTIKELLLSNTATQCRNRELERLFNAQLHFLHKAIKNGAFEIVLLYFERAVKLKGKTFAQQKPKPRICYGSLHM